MITVLLDAMDKHIEDTTMMRNGCLTICQFRIPQDVVSQFPPSYFMCYMSQVWRDTR